MPNIIEWPPDGTELTVAEAAQVVGVSRAWLYPRISSRELPSYTVGRRRYVLGEDLRTWYDDHRATERART